MYIVREVKESKEFYYDIYLDNKKTKTVFIKRIKKERNGKEYLFLIDSNGNVIEKTFEYLNYRCGIKSINAREQAQSALKLLYSFLEIIGKGISQMDSNDISNFSEFLLGLTVSGNYISIYSCCSRTISSHNVYMDAIRQYMKKMNIKNELFFERRVISKNIRGSSEMYSFEHYITNKSRDSSFSNKTPKYISIDEYGKICSFLSQGGDSVLDKRDKVIIDLMYLLGMRIGEVLGITIEDLKEHPIDERAGIIILRNRLSDREDQYAKTCFKPSDENDYKSKVYTEKNRGYQEIHIPYKVMEELREYINASRDLAEFSDKIINNIIDNSKADSINCETNNYYVFLNKNGIPLGSSGWNKRLRKIYGECGISIDKESKKSNLSHRLRHGYAMFLKVALNKDSIYIQKKLRHRSIMSTYKYFNPTEEDTLRENIKIEEIILKRIKE